ncbi:MAG: HU family DNA-binding protein [Candidatus Omnitrophota bacterium]|nr:HU family DNA-binding protein [Candidatus Omnitrophota bacterium]
MNKNSLTTQVAKKTKLSKSKANEAIAVTLNSIKSALKKGERVQLIGFGSFWVKSRKARKGRNPRTGQSLQIKARKVPAFTAGSALKKAVR